MDFYVIDKSSRYEDDKYAFGEHIDQKTGDFEVCEECKLPVGMREWVSPRKVKLSKPSFGDFVFGTFATFLCSERFKVEYEKSGLKGIVEFQDVDTVKVKNSRKEKVQPPKYYHVKIKRGGARIDEIKSNLIREPGEELCQICKVGTIKSFEAVYIENNTWNGDDIFYPTGLPGKIITSQKFYDFIKQNNFTSISLIPAKEYKSNW